MTGLLVVVLVDSVEGSLPFSLWAGRVFGGINLSEHGSGNLGASNTFRFLGAKIATGVLIADIAKGGCVRVHVVRIEIRIACSFLEDCAATVTRLIAEEKIGHIETRDGH